MTLPMVRCASILMVLKLHLATATLLWSLQQKICDITIEIKVQTAKRSAYIISVFVSTRECKFVRICTYVNACGRMEASACICVRTRAHV